MTTVNRWATGVDIAKSISEEARLALLTKLQNLGANEERLRGLFQAGRLYLKQLHLQRAEAPVLSEQMTAEHQALDNQIIDRWIEAYREKVAKLAAVTCPPLGS